LPRARLRSNAARASESGKVDRADVLQASSAAVDDLVSAEVAGGFEAVRRGDADNVGTAPARKLGRELPHAPGGAGDEGPLPRMERP
jgi:hypothetical protein